MNCKECGCIIEQAIEGELICVQCWSYGQMDEDARLCDEAIRDYKEEQRTACLCPDCGKKSEVLGWSWDVEDVLMECPFCGIWQQMSGKAGDGSEGNPHIMQYEFEQHELAKIYHTEEATDTWQ